MKKKERRLVSRVVRCLGWAIAGLVLLAVNPSLGYSSNFSISPTSLELRGGAKSGVFSVINGGADKVNCQIDVKEWSQDSDGKDVYTDARDIVFFPKIMTVDSNEQRAVRIGIKGPPSLQEKTYRIFVEEIPSKKKASDEKGTEKISAGLTIAFRYAAPIFVKPVRQQESASIEKTEMSKGVVRAIVKNTGNIHVKILNVTFRGKSEDGRELFSKDVSGWYILRGLTRQYEFVVPQELCGGLSTVEVIAQSENFTFNGMLNVQKEMCAP